MGGWLGLSLRVGEWVVFEREKKDVFVYLLNDCYQMFVTTTICVSDIFLTPAKHFFFKKHN